MEKEVYFFPCSGIVGAGKSTAIKRFKKSGVLRDFIASVWDVAALGSVPAIVFVQEPVKLWRQKGWLQRFYANPDKYASAFQNLVFCTHCEAVEKCIKDNPGPLIIVSERSMYDQLLFWQQQVDSKRLTADDMYTDAYMMMWILRHRFVPEPLGIFFFYTTDIQQTMLRVKRRARAEELATSSSSSSEAGSLNASRNGDGVDEIKEVNGLTVEYQQQLLETHKAWFEEPLAFPPYNPGNRGIPCMHVISDAPFHENDGTLADLAKRMGSFIVNQIKKSKTKGV